MHDASSSADHSDSVWRELGDIEEPNRTLGQAAIAKDIDALQVHLNGDLVLPDSLILDATIPLDLSLHHADADDGDNGKSDVMHDAVVDDVDTSLAPAPAPDTLPQPHSSPQVVLRSAINSTTPSFSSIVVTPISNKVEPTPTTAPTTAPVKKEPVVSKVSSATSPTASIAVNVTSGSPRRARPASATAAAAGVTPIGGGVGGGGGVSSVQQGRVEKRVPSSLKEKREREARQFPSALLTSLDGTTSAEVRKMSVKERELVLYKRKLRNRESARRSRQKRQAALTDLQEEIGELQSCASELLDTALRLRNHNSALKGQLEKAHAENHALRTAAATAKNQPQPQTRLGA